MTSGRPVVLAYHRIADDGEGALYVRPDAFREQLRTLLRWGLVPAALGELGPGRFAVTLDDGYRDGYEVARPILDELGVPATFFVCPARVGGEFMTWEQLASLGEAGHVIGSHTLTHAQLPDLGDEELKVEVRGSREALEARLGPVSDFCYPHGRHDPRVRAAVAAAGYERAVVTPRGGRPRRSPLTIERSGIYAHDTSWRFRVKALGLHRVPRAVLRG